MLLPVRTVDFLPVFSFKKKKVKTLESWVADKNEKNTFYICFFFLALCPRSLISRCFLCYEPGVGEECLWNEFRSFFSSKFMGSN